MERTERYNYVFDQYDGDSFIYDLKEDKRIEDLSECADILNKKEKEIERWIDHKNFDTQIYRGLIDEIEELKSRLSNCIEPKEDYYVIVSNGWKNKKYGIAKVQQVVENYYIQETDEYLGSYSADREYGEFATLEEAKAKLEEVKNG